MFTQVVAAAVRLFEVELDPEFEEPEFDPEFEEPEFDPEARSR
ncbi:hypothetical protein [Nesterenkonia xinjiangensis]|uniref:Uncharacterized protein n=1 Tax=Nesterenkonia xinjiangensis TaxID=225327 RepID=A0A7Z0GMK7_9MICC|nr:hypothetical protein [Nesterenkonia xinjiangensis]NYJ78488.1 hypothetical protein [Nesterenkonia xinjiangensis]